MRAAVLRLENIKKLSSRLTRSEPIIEYGVMVLVASTHTLAARWRNQQDIEVWRPSNHS
jgi:hypothetical protein